MSGDQIRSFTDHEDNWDGEFDQNRAILLGEIAAQLAGLIERLDFIYPGYAALKSQFRNAQ